MPDRARQLSRFLTVQGPAGSGSLLTEFYKEEFIKHRQCLQKQREYYSEHTITQVEAALGRIIEQVEKLCTSQDADQVVSRLLRKLDIVTGLSSWSDSKNVH